MSTPQERRASSASRVSLETLVEICGNEPGIPAFEAEAVDVSARGMHLRTAYLPDSGAPLVCRFENGGKEIVVEGVVAWRKESARGGEFGVKFTALDSRSVDALRGLVAQNLKSDAAVEGKTGTKVRLHIDGLGSPMKARIRGGGTQKLEVGSNLEFLKVGRKLEIEDLEAGARRTALIDGVDVVIDPSTQVPQLVVALRYEGMEEDTPQPAVMDLGDEPEKAPDHLHITPGSVTTSAQHAEAEPEPSDELPPARATVDAVPNDDLDDIASPEAPQVGLNKIAGAASEVAGAAGGALKRASAGALRGVGQLFQGASGKIAALRAKSAGKVAKRTTAAPPGGPVSIEGKRVRQQQSSVSSEVGRGSALASLKAMPAKKKLAVGAGAAVVLATVFAMALKPSAEPPGAAAAGEPATVSVQGVPSGAPAAAEAMPTDPMAQAEPAGSGNGVSANVPLFGPTPMATLEPAPLGPVPEEEAAELADAKASAKAADEAADEEFSEEPSPSSSKTAKSKKASKSEKEGKEEATSTKRPEDVPAWGRGKMHLPTIHRLRLDSAGGEIRGVNEPTGFTVLIPGRKVMEKAAGLAKRDPRIARVRTTNTPGGAQVSIQFKDGMPAYRVRLRKDYIEFLISASTDSPKSASKSR
ncbi:MAG TPA: PilZ domain-containing protein [Polyangiaceae bacterium]|nr:PilZ domain-containing protein [Polyangiaceae bacterium]